VGRPITAFASVGGPVAEEEDAGSVLGSVAIAEQLFCVSDEQVATDADVC
jgi:hypothetical protein